MRYGSRAGHRWGGAGRAFDRSIEPRFDRFSPCNARAYIFSLLSRAIGVAASRYFQLGSTGKSFRGINHVKSNVEFACEGEISGASNIGVKVCENISFVRFQQSLLPIDRGRERERFAFFFLKTHSCFICIGTLVQHSISYNEASLSKIKQWSRRILAVALFVRMCKQWNYPFPARIYPDDIQPVANLPAGKHSRFYGHVRIHTCIKSTNSKRFSFFFLYPFHTKRHLRIPLQSGKKKYAIFTFRFFFQRHSAITFQFFFNSYFFYILSKSFH